MVPLTEFASCPYCRTSSIDLTISVFKCPSCHRVVCDKCVRGFNDPTCPNCTRSLDKARDKVGHT
jgi:hypothetical protein